MTKVLLILLSLASGKHEPIPNPNPFFADMAACGEAGKAHQAKKAGNSYACVPLS
jgi:hypothetical protein